MKLNLKMLGVVLSALLLGLVFVEPAFAGADTTFSGAGGPVALLTGWLAGSLGILISIIALAVAVISAITGRLVGVVSAVGVAIVIQVGPGVLTTMFTATLPL